MWTLAQTAIDVAAAKAASEAVKEAAGMRPSEFLMATLAIVSVVLILRHLTKREENSNGTLREIADKHTQSMDNRDAKMESVVQSFNDTVLKVNKENNAESKQRADDCHRQGTEMIKAIAVVSEMARDVKEVSQIAVAQTEAQRGMLEAQGKLLHEQRGVVHTIQTLAEATMIRLAQAGAPTTQRHEHHFDRDSSIPQTPATPAALPKEPEDKS